ncbi:hypothetical protein SAMN02927937_02392 [Paenimyroides aquimaris]|uniref:Uncharacterized protein n=1 Tax=Paenimyroides marinum TaxID=1159016 RepID=A0A1H6ME83_9FLAO|nr:hypothetical protein [Paenimyroides aquimaris]SEH95887.1 hypothetical protein SAMN02927937_02392 [Paenimyroides aquimaris]
MNNPQPLGADEVHLLKDVFKAVHRNFLRFFLMELFLFIVLGSHIALAVYIKPNGMEAVLIFVLIAGIFLWLIAIAHHYTRSYDTHRKALRTDMRQNRKHICSGRLSANGIEENLFVYHVDGQAVSIASKDTLLGWKIKRFDTLTDTDITLDYLPHSRLLLDMRYHEAALNATSETPPFNEDQIRALAVLPKNDRPKRQIIHEGIITEAMCYVFPIFFFIGTGIPYRYTFKKLNVRLANHLLTQVSKDMQIGQHQKVVEFLYT